MDKVFNQKIGLLGGAGPWASAYAHTQLVRFSQTQYGAVEDHEYPEILHLSIPFNGFGALGVENSSLVRAHLNHQISFFNQWGADVILMACNSLHEFYDDIKKQTNAEIIHLAIEGAKAVEALGAKSAAILSSQSSLKNNLHYQACSALGIETILPNKHQQDVINNLIYRVMGGDNSQQLREEFLSLAQEFEAQGAHAILSGCTELTWVSTKVSLDIKIVDCFIAGINKTLAQSRNVTAPKQKTKAQPS